jgi:hypothetical protein
MVLNQTLKRIVVTAYRGLRGEGRPPHDSFADGEVIRLRLSPDYTPPDWVGGYGRRRMRQMLWCLLNSFPD